MIDVSKDALWRRTAAFSHNAEVARPSRGATKYPFDLGVQHEQITFPDPLHNVLDVQAHFIRDHQIDKVLDGPPGRPMPASQDLIERIQDRAAERAPATVLGKIKARFGGGE